MSPGPGGVYQIICKTSEDRYIGCAINLKSRRIGHMSAIRHNHHPNPNVRAAVIKYGPDSFQFHVVESWDDMMLVPYVLNYPVYHQALNLESDIFGMTPRSKLLNVLTHNKDRKNYRYDLFTLNGLPKRDA